MLDPKAWYFLVLELFIYLVTFGLIVVCGYGAAKNQRALDGWRDECNRLKDDFDDEEEAAASLPPVLVPADDPSPLPCPSCATFLKIPAALIGKKVRCPKCQAVVDVPMPAFTAVTATMPSSPLQPIRRERRARLELPARPKLRGVGWYSRWFAIATLLIVAPIAGIAHHLGHAEPRPEWIAMEMRLDQKKLEPPVAPRPIEQKIDPPKSKAPEEQEPPQIVIIPDRETSPWIAASYEVDPNPSFPSATNLRIAEPDGSVSLWSRKTNRRLSGFKAEQPLGILTATSWYIFGQFADPQAKDARPAGDIVVWTPAKMKPNDLDPLPPHIVIPFKGSISRFIFRNNNLYFLDVGRNRIGLIDATQANLTKLVAVPSPGAKSFQMLGNGGFLVLCEGNVIEVLGPAGQDFASLRKFRLTGADITDFAVEDDTTLWLFGKEQPIPDKPGKTTNCFVVNLKYYNFTQPIAVTPLDINHPCSAVILGGLSRGAIFIGERKITTCHITMNTPPRLSPLRTFDLPGAGTKAGFAISPDRRLLALPSGPILGIEY